MGFVPSPRSDFDFIAPLHLKLFEGRVKLCRQVLARSFTKSHTFFHPRLCFTPCPEPPQSMLFKLMSTCIDLEIGHTRPLTSNVLQALGTRLVEGDLRNVKDQGRSKEQQVAKVGTWGCLCGILVVLVHPSLVHPCIRGIQRVGSR